mmetsp:Transcript_40100/g.115697  ORF Transcript_40100/g.115697 Transcript_40100/m.115697 type:complete len:662 (+) Transcript_40100:45-2030(+)
MSAEDVIIVGGGSGGETLQQRFLRFKKERARERFLAKNGLQQPLPNSCASTSENCRQSGGQRDEDQLRARFVETCKQYLGVPYARKFHEPDDPDYKSPLFLDCCGLVRRAVQDLQEDFGFRIGKWNQAYQFETLPEEVTFDQLKPGDLVFVEGTYLDTAKKPQRHNIVHVEVFIGGETGEATIGSRWSRNNPSEGKVRGVQIHPSYRYPSKNYEVHRFIFRSLSTWLQGTCHSTSYPDAATGSALAPLNCGGKSIFQDSEEEDEDEAGIYVPNPYGEAPVFYVGEGNNWPVVAEALERRGWRRLPFEAGFSTRFDLKWVEQRSKIDYKHHFEGQLINHIPNNDVITCKTRFLDTMHAHEAATGSRFAYHPSSYTSERAGDKLRALAEAEADPSAAWALKPARGNGGSGIELLRGAGALRARLFPEPRDLAIASSALPRRPLDGWVVQRYIERPLLVQARKFDVRAYCLIARTEPALWYFRPGYCKVALEPYDTQDLDNRFAHLTNACVQKSHPQYRELHRGKHIWSEEEVEAELGSNGPMAGGKCFSWASVHEEMRKSLAWIYQASRDKLERRSGYFDLLGIDFMLDADFRLHLLELNSNPAMFFDSSPTLLELVPSLVSTTLDVVLKAQQCVSVAADTLEVPAPFELLVDEASGFVHPAE